MASILVVDDERDVVTLITFLLSKDGHSVSAAYNGAEVLAHCGVQPKKEDAALPDLIILDVMMPVMDGSTACAKLLEGEKTRSIPVIILSAKGQMQEAFKSLPNVVSLVPKPFDPQTLRDEVSRILEKAG